MPICLLETNLSAQQIPNDLAAKFSKIVAQVLNKTEDRISVTVNPGMMMVRNGNTDPTMSVHIWSIGVFTAERNPDYARKFCEFFRSELPVIKEKRIGMLFHPIEAHQAQVV